ncbi:MAG: serine hydrolase [Promethearchaeota archaeon]
MHEFSKKLRSSDKDNSQNKNDNLSEVLEVLLNQIDEYIKEQMDKYKIPGIAIGILQNNQTIFAKGYGFSDYSKGIPITTKSTFMIGSISKPFTTIAIMQQWEQGKFDLDDDINQYLPHDKVRYVGFKKNWKKEKKLNRRLKKLQKRILSIKQKQKYQRSSRLKSLNQEIQSIKEKLNHLYTHSGVSFRRLLTHTAGIGELKQYSDLMHPFKGFYFLQPSNKPILPLEDRLKKGIPCYIKPGIKYSYANHGLSLIGYLLEVFSNQSYHDYIRENILNPLEMNNTDAIFSGRVEKYFAYGHRYSRGKFRRMRHLQAWGRPAGGFYSNVDDMLKFIKCLVNDTRIGNRNDFLLKKNTFDLILTPQFYVDENLSKIGLVFELYELEGKKFAWHGGYTYGFNCAMHICPEEKFGLIILSNCSKAHIIYRMSRDIIWKFFDTEIEQLRTKAKKQIMILNEKMENEKISNNIEKVAVIKNIENRKGAINFLDKKFAKLFVGKYGRMRGWLTNTRFFISAGEFKVIYRKGHLILKTLWGLRRKGVKLFLINISDKEMEDNKKYLFRFFDKLSLHNILPYENVIFFLNKNLDKQKRRNKNTNKAEALAIGFGKYPRKTFLKSLWNKIILIRIIIIAIFLIAIFLNLNKTT